MLGRFEQQNRVCSAPANCRPDRHADVNLIWGNTNDVAHDPNFLGEIDQDDRVSILRWTRVHDCNRMDDALSGRRDPLPVAIARPRLSNPWREEDPTAGDRTLETKFPATKRFAPLLLRPHDLDLWSGQ